MKHTAMIPATMSVETSAGSPDNPRFKYAAAAILVLAALFRLYGQDWDDGHYFHPDERFIATVMDSRLSLPSASQIYLLFDPASSPLNTRSDDDAGNPQEFAYGSLPFLVTTVIGTVIGTLSVTDPLSYPNVGEFGRFLTAIIDLGTVALVMLFARQAFGNLAALIAGVLTACSVVLIQLAHFFTVDTWVTFFTMATLYASLQVATTFSMRWLLVGGALGGAALATKVSVGVLGIPILVAMAIGVRVVTSSKSEAIHLYHKRLLLVALPTTATFLIFEPYALWRPRPFLNDIQRQWEIVSGHFDIPFTRQFVGTISGLNEIENLVLWGLAPGFGIAALASVGIGIYLAIARRDLTYILLLSWIVPYFYVIASSEARFIRYAAPLVPPLAIIVGDQLARWWNVDGSSWLRGRLAPASAIVAVIGVTLAWAMMFTTVYSGTHPRIEASTWIYENVEPGSTLTYEVWDDRLPVRLPAGSGEIYQHEALDLYRDRPNDEAVDYIGSFLTDVDYIILASQRLSHSIPRLPWRYPVQSEYYRLLEAEKLGFELAYEATNYPGIGSLRINTLRADESFSVYDHPPVRIYRKVEELSREEIELRFAHAVAQPRIEQRYPDEPTLRLGEPVNARAMNDTAEWSSTVTSFSPVAVLVWIMSFAALTFAAVPVTTLVFARFPDGGLGFAPLVGLLGTSALAWLVWSLEVARLHLWLVAAALIGFAALSWVLMGLPADWKAEVRERRSILLSLGITSAVAFGIVLLLRAINPDLWHPIFGGEKPMETAYLNALLRGSEFPPHDPWFADGLINYYYYGFFVLVTVWTITGIPSEIAFQLSLATVAGSFAAGLFSLGSAITSHVLRTRHQAWLIAGGVITATMVMLAGNIDAIRQVISGREWSVDFWASSRVVDFGINEFPYFSLLYGDLHPHLIAAPMLVLVVALAFAWIVEEEPRTYLWLVVWGIMVAVAAGSVTVVNLWDGPTAAVILLSAIVFQLIRSPRRLKRNLVISVITTMFAGAISYFLFARFFSTFAPQTGGLEPATTGTALGDALIHFGGQLLPLVVVAIFALIRLLLLRQLVASLALTGAGIAAGTFMIALLVTGRSDSGIAALLLSGFLVTAVGALVMQSPGIATDNHWREIGVLMIAPFVALAGALVISRPVAASSALLVAGFLGYFVSNSRNPAAVALTITGAAGAGLVLVADLVFFADHLFATDWERMNTIFKLYFQSWTLMGLASAIAAVWLARRAWPVLRSGQSTSDNKSRLMFLLSGTSVVVFALVLLTYPILATPDRLTHQMDSSPSFPSLDGWAWMEGGSIVNTAGETIEFTGDRAAAGWLIENSNGTPVILEASIGAYRGGGSRISSMTGFPSVLGWASHQSQQRDGGEVALRDRDVRELYQTSDVDRKRYLLRRYRVDYVIIGDVERYSIIGELQEGQEPDYYGSTEGLEAFDRMVGEDLEVVFESGNTRLYQVLPFPSVRETR